MPEHQSAYQEDLIPSFSQGPALAVAEDTGRYTISILRSIEERDLTEWAAACGGHVGTFMDPRFLRMVENSIDGRYYNVVVYDPAGMPAAAAFLSLFRVDGTLLLSEGWKKKAIAGIRKLWPNFLKVQVLFCGSPISAGASHLRMAPDADPRAILHELDGLLLQIARTEGARFIVFKEFKPAEAALVDCLPELGYFRADSLRMNNYPAHFRSFDDVCGHYYHCYRNKVHHSQKKFDRSGLRVEHVRGSLSDDALYQDVHQLYLESYNRAKAKFECLPLAFFRELSRQFGDGAAFTLIRQDERLVAFICGIFDDDAYISLVGGYDHELNHSTDLYFNLMWEDLDYALRQNVRFIQIGQTTDDFKARMGCVQEPRWFYVKARPRALHWLLRANRSWVFPPVVPLPELQMFHGLAGESK